MTNVYHVLQTFKQPNFAHKLCPSSLQATRHIGSSTFKAESVLRVLSGAVPSAFYYAPTNIGQCENDAMVY